MEIYKKIVDLESQAKSFALTTVISASGSTPRDITAKMLVEENGRITDTIGGGPVEKKVIEDALDAIKKNTSTLQSYKLNKEVEGGLEMNCGGEMSVFIEVFHPKPRLILIGAGHVNYALAKIADIVGYPIEVADDREEFCNHKRFPMTKNPLIVNDYTKDLEQLKIAKNDYVVIATKNDDKESLEGVLHSEARYIGLIGSRRKVKKIFDGLLEEGYNQEQLTRVYSPIGLDIGAQTPEEIAISILGEIIASTNGGNGQPLHELRGF